MAKPQGSSNSKPASEEEPDGVEGEAGEAEGDDDGPPPGFGLVTPQQGRQNWWVIKPGAVFQGRLLGVFERRGADQTGQFLQIRVAKPTKAVIKGGEEVTVAINGTVNVDVKKGLADLAKLAADGGTYDVWVKAVEKVDIGNNKTFWRYDVRKKVIKPPPTRAEERQVADEEIPF